ncbi:MAG: substrate-binding domain-containing protein [Caldilineaceae bacterium]|nr:substrate-binding domain-containing protein [Caldilineaceae bacterium]
MKLQRWIVASLALVLIFALAACAAMPAAAPAPAAEEAAATEAAAPEAAAFDPDNEADSLNYDQLTAEFGEVPTPSKTYKIGAVMKFLGNQYWQLLAEGMQSKADEYGIEIDVQAAQTEADQLGQLAIMETMIEKGYDALLVSPQTDTNLIAAVEKAREAGILVLNVNDAVLPDAVQWTGPKQYENGVRAAQYLIANFPDGGKVAVIEGQAGVYAAVQRTKGFKDTLEGANFEVVASVPGDWDLQKSLDAATTIIQQHPDIKAFYNNNDTMALGVVEAVKNAGKLGEIMVIGTDGIGAAYDSIKAGEMTGTVDSFPYLTGQTAVEVALRLLEGQDLPRAVYSPQNLITAENVDNPMPAPAE